ncbi:hypothetical protein LOD99_5696 [Oopsacas minuta]|uniref:Uncharacterized protein n=1 Tax=Oopsacas minuta TaxID=111878 RepID=A0AAV7JPV3_9METZ|nr:hypothetical protein LOD99_5696 [Oopsacas minuta]
MECLRLSEPDYIAELTVNLNASKFEIQTKFNSIKANLDLQERFIIDQLNAIYSENLKSIQELQECRTQTLESKVTLSESMQNSNHLKLLSQNFDSTIENLNSQIQNLTRIKFSWNIPNDLENLIHIDGSATNVKIDKQVTKGEGPGQLSGFLQAMKVYKEKIYVADNKANAIKIFTRKGDMLDSYTHTKLRNPLSMTIDRRYLYVLTKINLFKISTIDLDTLSIVKLNPRDMLLTFTKKLFMLCA